MTCKNNPCCGERLNCNPPEQFDDIRKREALRKKIKEAPDMEVEAGVLHPEAPVVEKDIVEFPVFVDNRGNAFVFPGVHKDNKTGRSIDWSWCRYAEMQLGVREEKDRLCVERDAEGFLNFSHVVASAGSSGFAHGGATVWMISGPEYDKVVAESAKEPT